MPPDAVATRMFGVRTGYATKAVRSWVDSVLKYATTIIVAVDGPVGKELLPLQHEFVGLLRVIVIEPWIGYSAPLNLVLAHAASTGARTLLLQSLEVRCKQTTIEVMSGLLDDTILVVGAKMTRFHAAWAGEQPISANNSPWNTLALWNVPKLRLTGFLALSDGTPVLNVGGMEEVVTISVLQHLYPHKMRAIVANLGDIAWEMSGESGSRMCRHWRKMMLKYVRAETLLKQLAVPRGVVEVIDCCPG